jgi:carboxylesterase type B
MKLSWFEIVCALSPLVNGAQVYSDQLLARTDVGSFRGKLSSATVRSWLGIPFGASTHGESRFQPPHPAKVIPDGLVFNATNFGTGCPQNKGAAYTLNDGLFEGLATGSFAEGDDCLNLNIWAPTTERMNGSSAAVLVWIYGGGLQYGGAATPFFDGNNFVRDQDDIVLVSINYRTNIFGSAPLFSSPHGHSLFNPGQLDQRLAVEWVRSNIHHFGGNASRVTLFGESAGAGAIGAWAYAYPDDPIASGLIMQSGTETVYDPLGTIGTNTTATELAWDDIATRSGCNLVPGNETSRLRCMQALPWQTIQSAVVASNQSSIGAVVDNKTLFTQQEYALRRASGAFARIPVLIGSNSDEGAMFAPFFSSQKLGDLAITADVITLYGFTCPATAIAKSRTLHNVTAYQYRYFGQYPNLSPVPGIGAYHSAEIPIVFGTYNLSTTSDSTVEEIQTSNYIQGAWAAFSRDPSRGLEEYGWKRWEQHGLALNELAVDNKSGLILNQVSAFNTGCSLLYPELGT